jgi:excinuclease ABC subunit C
LLIVDGGKGQLGRSVKVLKEFGLEEKVLTAGLAKENEFLFLPGKDLPLEVPRKSQGLFLLQRIRDEAHRFAITAHRNLRSKERLVSRLDQIPGIGPARKKALLTKFGSLSGVKKATPQQISEVPGITAQLANDIWEALNK